MENISKATQESTKKWGKDVMREGFTIFPAILFRGQQRLGLNSTQMMVLIHLADYWWQKDNSPRPAMKTIAERMGISRRQLQRYMGELEQAGLVKRIERKAHNQGKLPNEFDLSGLVERLKKLAPEFREAKEQSKAFRKGVTTRGGNKQLHPGPHNDAL